MKKAQTQTHLIMYVLALIIFSFVLWFGYRSYKGFIEEQDELFRVQLIKELSSEVNRAIGNPGNVKKLELSIQPKYEKICFVDNRDNCNNPNYPSGLDCGITTHPVGEYPLICDTWKDCARDNAFFVKKDSIYSFYAGKISVENGFFCQEIKIPRTVLRIYGEGSYASISPWDE